jgi:hypothetical protein
VDKAFSEVFIRMAPNLIARVLSGTVECMACQVNFYFRAENETEAYEEVSDISFYRRSNDSIVQVKFQQLMAPTLPARRLERAALKLGRPQGKEMQER